MNCLNPLVSYQVCRSRFIVDLDTPKFSASSSWVMNMPFAAMYSSLASCFISDFS